MTDATTVNSRHRCERKDREHTGAACIEWNGHIAGDGFSVAGNMLAGAQVLNETAAAYRAGDAMPFQRRLVAAMLAGEAAGGDKQGEQSAALLIYGEEEWSDPRSAWTITPSRFRA